MILGQKLSGPNLLGGVQDDLVMFLPTTTGYVLILNLHRIRPIEVLSSAEFAHAGENGSQTSLNGDLNSSTKTHRAQAGNHQKESQEQRQKPKDGQRTFMA